MNYTIAMRSAFSRPALEGESIGGNPAGILIAEQLPAAESMLHIAYKVGASETVFAAPLDRARRHWKVRYYSPEQEIPFCGHATIALIAELHEKYQHIQFTFSIAQQEISVAVVQQRYAVITTPEPSHEYLERSIQDQVLQMFALEPSALNNASIALVNAGSNHLAIELKDRETLCNMQYDFEAARVFMQQRQIATIALFFRQSPYEIYIRNAFAFGGVYEDPATGSGAAAVAGFLYATKSEYKANDRITFLQGDDMGEPCTLITQLPGLSSESLQLIGESRKLAPIEFTI